MLSLASFLSLSSAGVTTLCFNGSFDAAAADDSAPLSKGLPPSDADETLPTADRFSLELRLFAGHSALCKALASHCVHPTKSPPPHFLPSFQTFRTADRTSPFSCRTLNVPWMYMLSSLRVPVVSAAKHTSHLDPS